MAYLIVKRRKLHDLKILVDDDVYERLKDYKFHLLSYGGFRNPKLGQLYYAIMKDEIDNHYKYSVNFKNGNAFDYRKENLILTKHSKY